STSPGRKPSRPNAFRKWRTVAGRQPMNEGMLPEFWASANPRESVSTHAKSLASFESVENDVLTMALAASSTTEMRRVHSTSSVTASSRVVMSVTVVKGRRESKPARQRDPTVVWRARVTDADADVTERQGSQLSKGQRWAGNRPRRRCGDESSAIRARHVSRRDDVPADPGRSGDGPGAWDRGVQGDLPGA